MRSYRRKKKSSRYDGIVTIVPNHYSRKSYVANPKSVVAILYLSANESRTRVHIRRLKQGAYRSVRAFAKRFASPSQTLGYRILVADLTHLNPKERERHLDRLFKKLRPPSQFGPNY